MRPIGLEKYWDIDHRLWPKLSPNIVVASPIFLKKEKKWATCQRFPPKTNIGQNKEGNKCEKLGGLQAQKVDRVGETWERWHAWSQGGDMV